jgi:chromosome segregation ATPase
MAKDKHKNLSNRNQDHSPSSEPRTPTSPNPGHPNIPDKLDPDLKAYLMMMEEDIKKDSNNSLKEIQENTAKQVEDLKEEAQKSLKELQENATKQVMELNKTIQDLKREVDRIKKTKSKATLEIETLGKKSGTIDASNRIQEMEERISGAEDSIENIGTTIKENTKSKKILTQNI